MPAIHAIAADKLARPIAVPGVAPRPFVVPCFGWPASLSSGNRAVRIA